MTRRSTGCIWWSNKLVQGTKTHWHGLNIWWICAAITLLSTIQGPQQWRSSNKRRLCQVSRSHWHSRVWNDICHRRNFRRLGFGTWGNTRLRIARVRFRCQCHLLTSVILVELARLRRWSGIVTQCLIVWSQCGVLLCASIKNSPFYVAHWFNTNRSRIYQLDRIGSHWFTLDHIGSPWITFDHIGSHWISFDHIGSHLITLDRVQSHWNAICIHISDIDWFGLHCITFVFCFTLAKQTCAFLHVFIVDHLAFWYIWAAKLCMLNMFV